MAAAGGDPYIVDVQKEADFDLFDAFLALQNPAWSEQQIISLDGNEFFGPFTVFDQAAPSTKGLISPPPTPAPVCYAFRYYATLVVT